MNSAKHWYDYFWIWTIVYFILGFFNILFAWLGMFDFLVPLLFAIFGGNKWFCNHMCGRGQLLTVIPQIPHIMHKRSVKRWRESGAQGAVPKQRLIFSRGQATPAWMPAKWFRYGFLVFFLAMFGNILYQTWKVYGGATLRQAVTLFWTFSVPWDWAYTAGSSPEWVAQYVFGFYSLMLTSAFLGLILMVLYKPRTWCSFCPMGTMTQLICRFRHRKEL
ncbi:4Fe-4S binding protein [bacterium]|nr:4Fe-4S binding protein [bacterium]